MLDALQFEGGSIGNHNRQLAWPLPTPTPVGPEGPLVPGRSGTPHRMPYYIFHYTYGIEYSREGLPMELQVGEWSLDKRHYMARHPPRDLDLPPACGHDRAHVLTALFNNASAALEAAPGGWPTPRSPGSLAGFARLHLRPPPGGKGGPAAGELPRELPTAWGDATAASLLGTGPWTITGTAGGGSLRVEKESGVDASGGAATRGAAAAAPPTAPLSASPLPRRRLSPLTLGAPEGCRCTSCRTASWSAQRGMAAGRRRRAAAAWRCTSAGSR